MAKCVIDETECDHKACAIFRNKEMMLVASKSIWKEPVEPMFRTAEVWENLDAFGNWVASMWFSGDSREMTQRDLSIMGLGIAGEAGEVVEKIKKHIRDGCDPVLDQSILKELGDVIYYAIRIGQYYGYKPSDILRANYEKLTSRKARGTERGSGDNR